MDLDFDNVQSQTAFVRQPRHHEHHEHHHEEHVDPAAVDAATGTRQQTGGHTRGHDDHGHGSMTFHFGATETILFGFWRTNSTGLMFVSCIVVFFIAVMYEGLKSYREWLKKCDKKRLEGGALTRIVHSSAVPSSRSATEQLFTAPLGLSAVPAAQSPGSEPPPRPPLGERCPWLSLSHLYQTFLHVVQVTISFLLMLIFMTYNVNLCIAVVLGAGFGYFIFFARRENVSDHCN